MNGTPVAIGWRIMSASANGLGLKAPWPMERTAFTEQGQFLPLTLGLLLLLGMLPNSGFAATSPSDPTTQWIRLPYAPGVVSDYIVDQQTGSAEGDLVGTNDLPAVYTTFVVGNSPTNGTIGYRLRIGQDAGGVGFKGVAHMAVDANADGKLDLFLSVDNSGSSDSLQIFGAGNGANISPSTTSVDSQNPLFTYSTAGSNYHWAPVTAVIDPAVTNSISLTPLDLDGGGAETDHFVSYFFPFSDLVSAFATVGVTGVTSNSIFRYIAGTATQPNSINQDINGINGGINSTVAYTNLGIFTLPISAGGLTNFTPVAVNDTATVAEDTTGPISPLVNDTDGDGDVLTITSATTTNGTVTIVGTNLVFTASTNFSGSVTIDYTISDGKGGTNSAVVTVTVTAVNDAPVAANDTATTPEDILVTISPLNNDSDVEGDPLTIIAASTTNGTVTISGTNLLFRAATNFNGQVDISYTINDGNGGSASATVAVTVSAVNDVPIAANDSIDSVEDIPITISPLLNDGDVDGDILTITNATTTNGTVTISGTNVIFTPGTNFSGVVTLDYSISDGNGGGASASITVNVLPANDVPIALDDVVTTLEDTLLTFSPLTNDFDIDGDLLTITNAATTNGTISISGTNLLFLAETNFNGTVFVSYGITDGNGGSASAVVSITVGPVNDSPVANNDTVTIPEDSGATIAVLGNDSDTEGAALTITLASATNGTVSISGTNLLFTPNTNFNGLATIGYTIDDGAGGTATALVNITVTPVNDIPLALGDLSTTPEDSTVTIPVLVNDSDIDGDALLIAAVSSTNGSISVSGTNVVFTPGTNFNGSTTLTYTISDGNGGTNTANVTVTVTPLNDPPVAVNDSATTPEDSAMTISVLVNDSDVEGNVLSITLASATNGSVTISGTNLLFTPSTNFNGTATIGYSISDGNGGSASALVTVTVTALNDDPVAVDDLATTPEDTEVIIPVLVNDIDVEGDVLTIFGVSSTNGVVSFAGTNVVFTPGTNFTGTTTLLYVINDGQGGTAGATVVVTVTPGNDPPLAVNDTATTTEDTTVTIAPLVNDSDLEGNPLTIIAAFGTNGVVSISGTNLLFTPNTNFNGLGTIGYTVADGNGGEASAVVTVTVTAANDPPLANNDSATVPEDTQATIPVLVNDLDPEGDTLSITLAGSTNGTVSISGTNLLFTPSTNFYGVSTLSYTISDGNGGTASATVAVTVTSVNDAPVAANDVASTPEDVAITVSVLVNDNDVDGDPMVITSASATNGSVSISGTNLVFTPATNFNGTATIGYAISDTNGGTAAALVTITVTPVNDPPVAVNDLAGVTEDATVTIPVLVNDSDVDGNPLNITLATTTNGTVSVSGTNLLFTPDLDFQGIVNLSYTISDGQGGTASAIVTVTVSGDNDAPIAADDIATTQEDTQVTIAPLINDFDIDGDPLGIIGASAVSGAVSVAGTNLLYTPGTNFTGITFVNYTISDGQGGIASASVTVSVTPVNDPPIAGNDLATTPEETTVTIPVLVNDSDIDGGALTISTATTTNGVVSISGTNLLFTPSLNFNGPVNLSYSISDGNGGTAAASVAVTVTPVNDPPVAVNDNVSTPEDTPVTISVLINDSDVDGNTLTITAATVASGTVSITGTNLLFRPATNFNGLGTISYTISDGNGGFASATATVTVTAVNDGPIAANDAATTPEDTTVVIAPLVNDSEPDGEPLTITSASTTNGTISVSGTNLIFLSSSNFFGPVTLGYTIRDPLGVTASAIVTVTVTAVNDAPVAQNDAYVATAGMTLQVPGPGVLSNDSDVEGSPLTATVATGPAHGSLILGSNGSITYTPQGSYAGPDSFTYTAGDGLASSAPATVNITVAPGAAQFAVRQEANVFNPQTGLFEQRVTVTNIGASTVAALRVTVQGLRSGVTLHNRSGTDGSNQPYVQYNSPLNPTQSVVLRLEFFVPDRRPFTNSLFVEAVLPAANPAPTGDAVDIDGGFFDYRISEEPRYVIEFSSIKGRSYTIIYSEDNMQTWRAATPSVTATANRTQWYDDGPPKTHSHPLSVPSRFYRVILNP